MIAVPVADNFSPNSTSTQSGRAAPRFLDHLRGRPGDLRDRFLRPGKRFQHVPCRLGCSAGSDLGPC